MIVEMALRAALHLHAHPALNLLAAAASPSLQPPRRRPARCSGHEEEEEEEEQEDDHAGSIEGGLHSPLLSTFPVQMSSPFPAGPSAVYGGGTAMHTCGADISRRTLHPCSAMRCAVLRGGVRSPVRPPWFAMLGGGSQAWDRDVRKSARARTQRSWRASGAGSG